LLLATAESSLCADAPSDWTRVQRLPPASRLVVDLRSGPPLAGRLLSADDARLEIDVAGRARAIARSDVVRIVRLNQRVGRRTMIALGTAAGVAVGIAVGAIYDAQHPGGDDPGAGKLAFGILGFFGGFAAGAVAGAHGARDEIIYEAPPSGVLDVVFALRKERA